MSRTFSYKNGCKYSPKMASKYFVCENNCPTFTIGNGWEKSWANMTQKDLMAVPWMKEAIEATDAKTFINDCLGFDIERVTEAGAIHLKHHENMFERHLRILKNTKKPSRFLLMGYYRMKGGEWEVDPNYPCVIRCATVSTNVGTLEDGFRVYTDGPKKYLYSRDGKERLYVPPVHDDYYCSCCHDPFDLDD